MSLLKVHLPAAVVLFFGMGAFAEAPPDAGSKAKTPVDPQHEATASASSEPEGYWVMSLGISVPERAFRDDIRANWRGYAGYYSWNSDTGDVPTDLDIRVRHGKPEIAIRDWYIEDKPPRPRFASAKIDGGKLTARSSNVFGRFVVLPLRPREGKVFCLVGFLREDDKFFYEKEGKRLCPEFSDGALPTTEPTWLEIQQERIDACATDCKLGHARRCSEDTRDQQEKCCLKVCRDKPGAAVKSP